MEVPGKSQMQEQEALVETTPLTEASRQRPARDVSPPGHVKRLADDPLSPSRADAAQLPRARARPQVRGRGSARVWTLRWLARVGAAAALGFARFPGYPPAGEGRVTAALEEEELPSGR